MSVTLLELRCPDCDREFPIRGDERIFVCAACGRSFQTSGEGRAGWGRVTRVAVAAAREPGPGLPLYYLPMWVMPLRTAELGSIGDRMPAEIRVPGFGSARLPLLVQFARNLSRSPAGWSEATDLDFTPEPVELEAIDAFTLAEIVVLRHVEGWPPDDVADISIPLGSARLLDWPFTRQGHELIDLVAGLTLHASALGGLQPRDLSGSLSRVSAPIPRPR